MGGWSQERREVGGVAIRGNATVRAGFHLTPDFGNRSAKATGLDEITR